MPTATAKPPVRKPMAYEPQQYSWKEGARFPVAAQVAGEELERISQKHGLPHGMVPAKVIVEESRPTDAALHNIFVWDNVKAGELYRCHQAGQVARSIRIIRQDEDEKPKEAIHYVSVVAEGRRGYVATAKVMTDADLREQALGEAMALLRGVKNRFGHLQELAEVVAAIDRLLGRVG